MTAVYAANILHGTARLTCFGTKNRPARTAEPAGSPFHFAEQEDHQENQRYHQSDHYDRFFIACIPEGCQALLQRDCISLSAYIDDSYFSHGKLYSGPYVLFPVTKFANDENEASIRRKLELVDKYDLKGVGSWSLGQETKETWEYYALWLEGINFSDIRRHWAKDSIMAAVNNGWMNGVSRTRFEPDSPMTRAQAAALLVRVLDIGAAAADSGVSAPTGSAVQSGAGSSLAPAAPSFADTAGHWAQKEIDAAVKAGILVGVGGGRFEPDAPITREQMAVLLDRLLGGNADAAGPGYNISSDASGYAGYGDPADSGYNNPAGFSDTDPSRLWSYGAITRMAAGGFIRGFHDGTFRPLDAINRGQMAVLIERVAPYLISEA